VPRPLYCGDMDARTAAGIGLGWLGDVAGILLIGVAIPVAILIVGMPVALLVRLLVALAERW
jgi:hypothetical protein